MANILVVDDIAIMRKKIGTMLMQAGHTIIAEADDGEQAFKEYERHRPDLVMMDITMPNLDGIGAVRKIIRNYPDAKIIMVSALAQKHMVLQALQFGARNYIIKPVDYKRLIDTVDKVLSDFQRDSSYEGTGTVLKPQGQLFHTVSTPFAVENDKGVFRVKLSDKLEMANIDTLTIAIQGFLVIKPINIVFDFGGLDFLDEEILHVIVDAYVQIRNMGGTVRLESMGQRMTDVVLGRYGHLISLN